jgi:sensor histidine kinase YesM
MNNIINTRLKTDVARLEFWIVTAIIAIAFIVNVIAIQNAGISAGVSFGATVTGFTVNSANSIIAVLFNYIIVFISYLLLCFYVAPAFEHKETSASNSLFVFVFIAGCFTVGIIDIYFATLLALKILIVFFNRNKQNKSNALYYETALLTASWILMRAAMFYLTVPGWVTYYILYDVPALMIVYLYAVHRVLPWLSSKKRRFLYYLGYMLLLNVLSTMILAAICAILSANNGLVIRNIGDEYIAVIIIGNFFGQLIIVLPLAWNIYQRRNAKKDEEIKTLKTELGQSDANLNFLKSQINPHFLFNALNTLYGTALQENAERTGEGIQKLGDMMRFMLEENVRDRILLSRDIDYLKNYILLQKLRTSASSSIIIETQIEDYQGALMITPMLLIPFVENAFKHGISLQNPSHIKVTLQTDGNTLYFDVHNSIHIRHDNDPEKGQSGIGLDNVKQRLALLYPNRHDLVIRENAKEFFIHLTVQLDII